MISESQTSIKLPILDMSEPSSVSTLADACKEWGFFLIKNHGISKDLYNKIHLLSKQVFGLPLDIKLKLGPFSSIKTYTPHFIASPFFESLRVSGPDFAASAQSSADVLLDQQNNEFSEILQEYGSKMTELSKGIVKIVLKCLGDDFKKKFYESEFKNCHGYLRINNYSSPESLQEQEQEQEQKEQEQEKKEQEAEGLGMHTDMSCVTIVYQDEIGGLQVRSKEGKWLDLIPCEGTLVVNIGDMLQAWSNEKFRSSEHRVVLKQPTNRFSLAFFWCFDDEKVILAPDEVVGEKNERIYRAFVCLDYLKFRENDEKGKFEKVGFTVKDFAGVGVQN